MTRACLFLCIVMISCGVRAEDLIGVAEQQVLWRQWLDQEADKKKPTLLPLKILIDFEIDARLVESIETPAAIKSGILRAYDAYQSGGDEPRFAAGARCRSMCLTIIKSDAPAWLRFEAFVRAVAVDNFDVRHLAFSDAGRFVIAADLKKLWEGDNDTQVREWLQGFKQLLAKGESDCFKQALKQSDEFRIAHEPATVAQIEKLTQSLTPFFKDLETRLIETLKKPEEFAARPLWERKMLLKCYSDERHDDAPAELLAHLSKLLEDVSLPDDLRAVALRQLSRHPKYTGSMEKVASSGPPGLRLDAWHCLYGAADAELLGRLIKLYETESDPLAQAAMFRQMTQRLHHLDNPDPNSATEKLEWEVFSDGLKSDNERVRYYAQKSQEKKW